MLRIKAIPYSEHYFVAKRYCHQAFLPVKWQGIARFCLCYAVSRDDFSDAVELTVLRFQPYIRFSSAVPARLFLPSDVRLLRQRM